MPIKMWRNEDFSLPKNNMHNYSKTLMQTISEWSFFIVDLINSEIGSAQNEGVAGEGGGLFLSGKTAKKRAKQ